MTPARPIFRSIPVVAALAVLGIATWAFSQLQAPEPKSAANQTALVSPAAEPESAQRTGAPQSAGDIPQTAVDTLPPATEAAAPEASAAPQAASETAGEAGQPTVAPPDMSAFIAALAAAERTNENLVARLAQMEASAALQRERDQTFIRDMIKGVLVLAGAMASIGMLALVAIVYLQLRSTKQQAITFAAQLHALTSHVALPPPAGSPSLSPDASRSQFDSTAQKIEQRLNDLESMASGLPVSGAQGHVADAPATEVHHAAVAFAAPQTAVSGVPRGERSSDPLSKADSLLMQQQPEVALAYIDQAINQNPRNPEAHLKRGSALERLNRLNEAIASYDRAIDAEPTLSVAFLAKAGVLNKLQRYGEALKCYEAALSQQGGGQPASESPAA